MTATSGATPSVAGAHNLLVLNYSVSEEITNLTGGALGQPVTLLFTNANVTINDAGNFASFAPDGNDTLSLINMGGFWFETARSVN